MQAPCYMLWSSTYPEGSGEFSLTCVSVVAGNEVVTPEELE